jgi:HlyD family secretion protein
VVSLPIQALTMHDPASDKAKSSGGVQAASMSSDASTDGDGAKTHEVQGVFVVKKDAKGRLRATFVPVTTGITGATDIEVLSGLSPGDEIVTGPYKTLRVLKGGSLVKRDKTLALTTTSTNGSS